MKMNILIYLLLFLLSNHIIAQDFEWAKRIGGAGIERGTAIAVSFDGNVYTTGGFTATADFGTGVNLINQGDYDIFISKQDSNGNFVWVKSIGTPYIDMGYSITIDSFENVYISGFFSAITDFDPGPGVFNLTPNYARSVFILKLDSAGNFVWAKSVGTKTSAANNYGHPYMTIDKNANVYISSAFADTIDFDPGIGVFNLGGGATSVFILKLDSSGDFVWAKKIGGWDCYGITTDNDGDVYSTGVFYGTKDFDPSPGVFNLSSSDGVYILKLDSLGNFGWAKYIKGSYVTYSSGIVVDINKNAYITGYFKDSADFNPSAGSFKLYAGYEDIFVLKLDSLGGFVWAKGIGGTGADGAYDIALDIMGNVYTTGYFFGTVDFDPNAGVFNLSSTVIFDAFICKLDSLGNFLWAKNMGGSDSDVGNAIAVGFDDAVYITGSFHNTTDFDPNTGIYNLTSAGNNDIFIHKMSQSPSTAITAINNPLDIALYPNPSTGLVYLEIAQDFRVAEVSVINALGQVLREEQVYEKNSILELPQEVGLYFVRVEVAGQVGVYKVMRE